MANLQQKNMKEIFIAINQHQIFIISQFKQFC
jgi:hypothetical protein